MSFTFARARQVFTSGRLWLLATLLSFASIYMTMSIVHDTSRRRQAVLGIAQAMAGDAANSLTVRTDLLAARGFAATPGDVAALHDSVFAPVVRAIGVSFRSIVEVDSATFQLARLDSAIQIGSLGEHHAFRASVPLTGALRNYEVRVALHHSQLREEFISPFPAEQLWILAHIGLLTIIVFIVAVRASRRELQLARARSDFVAGVSHELRMPLAQILLASETLSLERERSGTDRAVLSRSIVREARRLIGLVDNVLFFSRSDASPLPAHVQTVDVTALFAAVVESVELAAADARQSIHVPGTTLRVRADADLLRHALVNLVDNALKYGRPGQQIRLHAERADRGRVRLYVDDEGPGIPVEERARVFNAYERLARDQASEKTGTGLGLAIVRRIVDACNGRVWIDAAPSGGARVTIELEGAE